MASEQPLLLFTALISLVNCAFALTHFLTSPATEATHRARDELRTHVYQGEDEAQIQQNLKQQQQQYRQLRQQHKQQQQQQHGGYAAVVDGHTPFAARRKRKPPRRSYPMVLNMGILCFFASDLTLRVVSLCVFT